MEAQYYYFTGENAYALREELRVWKEQFIRKHGAENFLQMDASDVTLRTLLDEVGVAPFIAQKRLVVLRGTPSLDAEEVEKLAKLLHPDCVLVIADSAPDKRTSAYKALKKFATVKEYEPLKGKQLLQWMTRMAASYQSTFSQGAVEHLVELAGEDQDVLSREVEKLSLHAVGRSISKEDIHLLFPFTREQEVWRLTQLLAEGRGDQALIYAKTLLQGGEDPFSLWNLLLWMLRTLVTVTAAVQAGVRQPAAIASQYKVPFPSARNMLPLAQRIDLSALASLVYWAAATDRELKTGGYKASKEAPEELVALIDGFVLRCSRLERK